MRKRTPIMLIAYVCVWWGVGLAAETTAAGPIPRLLYLRTDTCLPCLKMNPFIQKIAMTYAGKVEVISIDLAEERQAQPKYGVKSVPTLIFYDRDGKEVYRQKGFVSEKQIKLQLKKMGVEE